MTNVYVSWECPDCGWQHTNEYRELLGTRLEIVSCTGCDREFKVEDVGAEVRDARS